MRCQLLLFMLLFVQFSILPADARYFFRDGSKVEIQWHEKRGKILNDKVCFNYQEDSKKYSECRDFAADYFADECHYYEKKIKSVDKKYRDMYAAEKEKFCEAAANYSP